MMVDGELSRRSPQLIVCGDGPLAYRIIADLVTWLSDEVIVILPSAKRNHGPPISALPKVRVIEAPQLSDGAFREAGVEQASVVALVTGDDIGNIHAALRAQELNCDLRLVIRSFDMSLAHRMRTVLPGCEVLSEGAIVAPFFVAAALGEVAPSDVQLPDRTLYVVRRSDVAESRVICALADTSVPGQPELLPTEQDSADLVLAVADDQARLGDSGDSATHRRGRKRWRIAASLNRKLAIAALGVTHRRGPKLLRTLRWRTATVLHRKLAIATLGLFALLGFGTVLFASVGGFSWLDALYLTVLDAAGAAQPDTTLSTINKLTQTMVTIVGVLIIPVVTATVVDAVVSARLVPILGTAGHVVVVGLGTVGTWVIGHLHDRGVPVVCVECDENAQGVASARRIGARIVFGDASREDPLRATDLGTSRALIAVTSDDIINLKVALHARAIREDLRIVLRSFNSDLPERAGITISGSVSYLAAPTFAAAMLGCQVLATIPLGRQVLLIADVPIYTGSLLDGLASHTVNTAHQAQVIAIHRHATDTLELPAPQDHLLASGDRLVVLATNTGLGQVLSHSVATSTPPS